MMANDDQIKPFSQEVEVTLEAWHAVRAWDALPRGPQRRQQLLDLVARFPDDIALEWESEDRVQINYLRSVQL